MIFDLFDFNKGIDINIHNILNIAEIDAKKPSLLLFQGLK
jgi:hypothetical protein